MLKVRPLWEMSQELAKVTQGKKAPDLILTNAKILCVYTEKIYPDQEIWIFGGRIARVSEAGRFQREIKNLSKTQIIDCEGSLLAPGLIDPHLHIESSRISVCAYAKAALLNGTTTIIADNHEMANVCDVEGIEWMIEDGKKSPLNVFWTLPSTVPATARDFETSGGNLTPEKISKLMDKYPDVVVGLGEKMDYFQVIEGNFYSLKIIAQALLRNLPVSGHVYGKENIQPYAVAGISDNHEAIDKDIALACLKAGMWLFLRGGKPNTAWDSLPETIKVITQIGCSPARICLCSDDRSPEELLEYGLDYVVREAIENGIDPVLAWKMASLNPATRYNLDSEIGGLAPGKRADIVLVDKNWKPQNVWLAGILMVKRRKPTGKLQKMLKNSYQYPRKAFETVKIPSKYKLFPDPPEVDSRVNVIGIEPSKILTRHLKLEIKAGTPIEKFIKENELAVMVVIERHDKTKNFAHGFLKGFGIQKSAIASTVSHDAHNLIVIGDNKEDMERAIEIIRENKGGICVVSQGKVKASIPLPIAGLMSDKSIEVVAFQSKKLQDALKEVGCMISEMEISLLSLDVIPEIRLTDKGLIKVSEMKILPLFEPL